MMNVWELPTTLEIGGVGYSIQTDYRKIINILNMLSDPEFDEEEKAIIYLRLFYKVKDVVGTYDELQAFDTSTLGNNDIVEVINDSTHGNARSYFRWVISTTGAWKYIGKDAIPPEHIEEALMKATQFINCDAKEEEKNTISPRLMDWEQDANMIISATNAVAGKELRAEPYVHWWTFLGYYMSIGDSLFSSVVNIREKKARGKKLEKEEREWYQRNKDIVDLKVKITDEEKAEEEAFLKELGL